jgi:hypothetical protein
VAAGEVVKLIEATSEAADRLEELVAMAENTLFDAALRIEALFDAPGNG